jgi:alanine dehydrogenase
MVIGVPKEIKNNEFRVGMTPQSVQAVIAHGHQVMVETSAGTGVGFTDQDYLDVGAQIKASASEVFAEAEMIVKVKEPQPTECTMLRENQILFTYLHLAPDPQQTQQLIASGAVCIAYETVENEQKRLPLLAPMSEVAGRMSIQVGAHFLEETYGGRGVLLGGVTGVEPAEVLIIGAGTVGRNAAQMAIGLGANVTILTHRPAKSDKLKQEFGENIQTGLSSPESIAEAIVNADLVVGAVLVPGASAPKLISKEQLKTMKPGAVIVDVAIDQGGCFETSRPTTHQQPIYIVDGIVHYCVANIPGAVPRTSTLALNNATLPYILKLADKGYKRALLDDSGFLLGLNVIHGQVTCENVAQSLNLDYKDPVKLLSHCN